MLSGVQGLEEPALWPLWSASASSVHREAQETMGHVLSESTAGRSGSRRQADPQVGRGAGPGFVYLPRVCGNHPEVSLGLPVPARPLVGGIQGCAGLGCLWACWWEGPGAQRQWQLRVRVRVREFRPEEICPKLGGRESAGREQCASRRP